MTIIKDLYFYDPTGTYTYPEWTNGAGKISLSGSNITGNTCTLYGIKIGKQNRLIISNVTHYAYWPNESNGNVWSYLYVGTTMGGSDVKSYTHYIVAEGSSKTLRYDYDIDVSAYSGKTLYITLALNLWNRSNGSISIGKTYITKT